jgi:hypothetical protein
MSKAKTHFGTVERANESDNNDYWSNTICGLEEGFLPLKISDNIKFIDCKRCLKAHPKFLESMNRALVNEW